MDQHTIPTGDSSLQDRLYQQLLRCRPRDPEVAALASTVKQHCGYFRDDVRQLLRQKELDGVEESDVTDSSGAGNDADEAAELANK